MVFGLLGAFAAALCYGTGSAFQAVAARETAAVEGLDAGLLLRLLKSWRYVLGVTLDGIGFVLSLAAVRTLPLFVVQSIVASSLAITAVLGVVMLGMKLSRWDRAGLAVVLAGLVLVALSATEDRTVDVSTAEEWGVLIAAMVLAVSTVPLARVSGPAGAAALGMVAGLAFGATAVAARMLPASLSVDRVTASLGELGRNPATYALLLAGLVALMAYATALQRGTVTQATAPLVVGETVAPAIVGIMLLGDQPRPGWEWVAAVGFGLAVLGAVSLSGHGEVTPEDPQSPTTPPSEVHSHVAEMGKSTR